MTEGDWIDCGNPAFMLEFLGGQTSSRKLRLFGCAVCRRIGHLLPESSRAAVDMVELYVDGLTTAQELQAARSAANDAWHTALTSDLIGPLIQAEEAAARAAYRLTDDMLDDPTAVDVVIEVAENATDAIGYAEEIDLEKEGFVPITWPLHHSIRRVERAKQCVLLRDIIGNPFQPTTVEPSWLEWNDEGIVKQAQAMYEQRSFRQLSVLEKLLEGAGCKDEAILNHCTCSGKHVLGCWLVDLLLGME